MSWSAGLAVSPFLGGLLVESSIVMALFAAVVFAALAFVAVTLAHPPEIQGSQRNSNDNSQVFLGPASFLLVRFRWMSRIALVTVFTCVGLKTGFHLIHNPRSDKHELVKSPKITLYSLSEIFHLISTASTSLAVILSPTWVSSVFDRRHSVLHD